MFSLTNKATTDLDSILDYSNINFGAEVMVKYHGSLEKCFNTLDESPELGTQVLHIRQDYLCFEHRSHLIFYKKCGKDILIIRILHKSMEATNYFN